MTSPVSLDDFINLRSLTLIECHLNNLQSLPFHLSRLSIQNIDLPLSNMKLIFEHSSFINVQFNLQHPFPYSSSVLSQINHSNSIQYLVINYISLNNLIQ
jgi:hypothetical protein